MGLSRAIPAQRFLAADASGMGAVFTSGRLTLSDDEPRFSPLVVFSPSMYLPAVIAKAEALAKFVFGSAEMLGVRRVVNEMGVLGVEADTMGIDGSAAGMLRALLLRRAAEQVFDQLLGQPQSSRPDANSLVIDLAAVTSYYRGEGRSAVRGERDDVLNSDPLSYDWTQK